MMNIINYKGDEIEIEGWREGSTNNISDFKIINFKRSTTDAYKSVYINSMNFRNSEFIDVDFACGVPIDNSTFKNCTFENCLFADHIRWSKFDNCTFKNCIFSGYLHGCTFKNNCKYTNVSLDFYGEDSYFLGKKVSNHNLYIKKQIDCSESKKKELYKYFYPNEYSEMSKYEVGENYYIHIDRHKDVFSTPDKSKFVIIDDKEYYKDVIKGISFGLMHSKPKIRIIGKYNFEIKDCISESEAISLNREQKLYKIL